MTELEVLRDRLREFAAAREWDQFHSPKNLAMALSAEAGELLEIFQWLTDAQSANLPPRAQAAARRLRAHDSGCQAVAAPRSAAISAAPNIKP